MRRTTILTILLLTSLTSLHASVPDSLLDVYYDMRDIVRQTEDIAANVVDASDLKGYKYDLENLDERMTRIKTEHREVLTVKELTAVYTQYRSARDGMNRQVEEFEYTLRRDSIAKIIAGSKSQLQQLNSQATGIVERRQPDSLAILKQKADGIFSEMTATQMAERDMFAREEAIASDYTAARQLNEQIQSVTAKQKTDIKDLLFKIILAAGMVIMIVGLIVNRVTAKRMMKNNDDSSAIEI